MVKFCCIPTHDKAKMSAENTTEGSAKMVLSTNICLPMTLAMVENSDVTMKRMRIVGMALISLRSVSAYSCCTVMLNRLMRRNPFTMTMTTCAAKMM